MANIDTRWEQALLNKVTNNGERIAVIERDVKDIKDNSLTMKEDISILKNDVSILKVEMLLAKKLIPHPPEGGETKVTSTNSI
ncbi:MAG: hypothetical protein QNJ41_05685 [Xenococcaceae cyanobacterium MO_188.B32]|nr:hypothetical protein [Xenococcaceae cyanobacterium MO_188.B32]